MNGSSRVELYCPINQHPKIKDQPARSRLMLTFCHEKFLANAGCVREVFHDEFEAMFTDTSEQTRAENDLKTLKMDGTSVPV